MYKVAIVEDQEFIANTIANIINEISESFEVCGVFYNGAECLAFMDACVPDIVLTDIKMPLVDGIELSKEIVRRWPSVEIIILSGYEDFSYAQTAISLGISSYLLKPCTPEDLTGALEKAVEYLETERKNNENANYQARYVANLSTLKHQAVITMLFTDYNSIKPDMLAMEHLMNENYLYLIVSDTTNQSYEESDLHLFCCHNILNELLEPIKGKELFICNRQIILIAPAYQKQDRTEFYLKRACARTQEIVNNSIIFYYGGIMPSIYECKAAYSRAIALYGEDHVISPSVESPESGDIMERACKYINENFQKNISLQDIADITFVSYNYLSSLFTQNMGINFSVYLSNIRIQKACELLKQPDSKVADVAEKVGYSNYRYFNYVFKKMTGYTPSEYRRIAGKPI